MRRIFEILAIALSGAALLTIVGFYSWTRLARYPAYDPAAELATAAEAANGWFVFEPEGDPLTGLIFYPGGLVDAAAYAPLMQRLSDSGALTIIVPMPLDLAVLGINRAKNVVAAYSEVEHWVIGGHSLGGAMACETVVAHPDMFEGLILLASYPAESTDLSAIDLPTVLIYGTEDSVSGDVFSKSIVRLPADTLLIEIAGGNHAQFGDYGPQKGDGMASITREDQQSQTAEAILAVLAQF